MTPLPTAQPSATFSELFPLNTVFAPRSNWHMMRWVYDEPFRADSITGTTLAIMGKMPLICHKNSATSEIIDFFTSAGLEPASNLQTYETEEEAVSLAKKYIGQGSKIAYVYPPPASLDNADAFVVPLSLYSWLNDKANLEYLVDRYYLPQYRIISAESLHQLHDFLPGKRVFIKVCYPGASGAGKDVYYCPDQASRSTAIEWLTSRTEGLSGIRIEEEVDIDSCWCLNFSILETSVEYLGAATQLFSAPSKQVGNRIDPDDLPPDSIISIAERIAEYARNRGYRGIAGFDIGAAQTGQAYVFDLNFRIVACTPQVLLHEGVTRRANARISQSWTVTLKGRLTPALKIISTFSKDGTLVPVRLFEATPETGNRSFLSGIISGQTVAEIESIKIGMQSALGNLLQD